jgi:hypothetical protein
MTMFATTAVGQYDGIGGCERYANAFYKARDSEFRSFVIDRKTVDESAFEDNVGSQHVTAIFRGAQLMLIAVADVTGPLSVSTPAQARKP